MSTTAKKTTIADFTPNSITINGKEFPAEYSLNPSGAVFVFTTVQEGGKDVKVRIKIDQNDAYYPQAVEAAKQERASREQAIPAAITTEPVAEPVAIVEPVPVVEPVAIAEPVPVAIIEPVPVTEPVVEAVPAAGPVPASVKPFIGTEIAGEGWKIRFDAACGRTRVILQSEPSAAMRQAIEKAGFYWSGVMKSWNKKLTVKAYRAAQTLALDLRRLCA